MKTNNIMKRLLDELQPSTITLPTELYNPNFTEWDDCILLDSSCLHGINSIKYTTYQDRTDLETSLNHYHVDGLITGMKLIKNWEEQLRSKYPERDFILILSTTIAGEDAVIRFYQYRADESEWIDINNLEGYAEEGILVIQILNVDQ